MKTKDAAAMFAAIALVALAVAVAAALISATPSASYPMLSGR